MKNDLLDRAFPHFGEEDEARLELIDKRLHLHPHISFIAIASTIAAEDFMFEQSMTRFSYSSRQDPSYTGTQA